MTKQGFNRYPKIPHLIKAAEDEIFLPGVFLLHEKLDGANGSIHRTETGFLVCSRNNILARFENDKFEVYNEFSGFPRLVEKYADIVMECPVGLSVYGEYMIPHTINYPEKMLKRFYVFDYSWTAAELRKIKNFRLVTEAFDEVPFIGRIEAPDVYTALTEARRTLDSYKESVGRDVEGLVLHPVGGNCFSHKYKVVLDGFKEDNRRFWVASKKNTGADVEKTLVNYYPIGAYLKKKQQLQDALGRSLEKKDISALLNLLVEDFYQEYFFDGVKNLKLPTVDTKQLTKNLQDHFRHLFLVELNTGELPMWAVSRMRKEQEG